MKHVVVILSIVLLAWAPGTVFAQGLFGPGCGMPSCDPAKKALMPALYVGYAGTSGQGRGLSFAYDGTVRRTSIRNYRWDVGFYGLQLAAELPFRASDAVTVAVSGSWLIPVKAQAVEERWLTAFQLNVTPQTREWNAKPQWYVLNATGEYALNESVSVLGGFMYDNTDVSINNPDVILGFGWRPDDHATLKLSSYIPYVGLSSTAGGFTAGLVGFPALFGTAKLSYNETFNALPGLYETSGSYGSGYFLQAWLEFNTSRERANAGVYAAYNLLHANASQDLDVNWPGNPFTGDYRVTFDRQIWMFGAKFSFTFDLPLLPRRLF